MWPNPPASGTPNMSGPTPAGPIILSYTPSGLFRPANHFQPHPHPHLPPHHSHYQPPSSQQSHSHHYSSPFAPHGRHHHHPPPPPPPVPYRHSGSNYSHSPQFPPPPNSYSQSTNQSSHYQQPSLSPLPLMLARSHPSPLGPAPTPVRVSAPINRPPGLELAAQNERNRLWREANFPLHTPSQRERPAPAPIAPFIASLPRAIPPPASQPALPLHAHPPHARSLVPPTPSAAAPVVGSTAAVGASDASGWAAVFSGPTASSSSSSSAASSSSSSSGGGRGGNDFDSRGRGGGGRGGRGGSDRDRSSSFGDRDSGGRGGSGRGRGSRGGGGGNDRGAGGSRGRGRGRGGNDRGGGRGGSGRGRGGPPRGGGHKRTFDEMKSESTAPASIASTASTTGEGASESESAGEADSDSRKSRDKPVKERRSKFGDGVDGVVNPEFAALLPGDSEAEMAAWIAQRRKKFPTTQRVTQKSETINDKIARGETLTPNDKSFLQLKEQQQIRAEAAATAAAVTTHSFSAPAYTSSSATSAASRSGAAAYNSRSFRTAHSAPVSIAPVAVPYNPLIPIMLPPAPAPAPAPLPPPPPPAMIVREMSPCTEPPEEVSNAELKKSMPPTHEPAATATPATAVVAVPVPPAALPAPDKPSDRSRPTDTGAGTRTGTGSGKRPCTYFFRSGHCTHGSECRYSHNAADAPPPAPDRMRGRGRGGSRGGGRGGGGGGGGDGDSEGRSDSRSDRGGGRGGGRGGRGGRGGGRTGSDQSSLHIPKPSTSLLKQLLTSEITNEHSLVLQCFRYFVTHNFLQPSTRTAPAPAATAGRLLDLNPKSDAPVDVDVDPPMSAPAHGAASIAIVS